MSADLSSDDLAALGALPDGDIDLAEVALKMDDAGGTGRAESCRAHLKQLCEETAQRYTARVGAGAGDTLATRLEALRYVLAEMHGYAGDAETYDDIRNACLADVIERRKGMPITLAVIYIHVARAQGWEAHGLNLPGHFVARLDQGGERLIFDPFNGAVVLQAADLRRLVKQTNGPQAELSADYYVPAANRTILVRLQNNIKIRKIEQGDYEGALRAVQKMRAIAPGEFRLLFDAGVLNARVGKYAQAVEDLSAYISEAPAGRDKQDAAVLLQQIRRFL